MLKCPEVRYNAVTWVLVGVMAFHLFETVNTQSGYTEWIIDVPREMTMFQTAGVKMISATFRKMNFVRYLTGCARVCATDTRCLSFNYNPRLKICELNSERENPEFHGFVPEEGFEFYAMAWFKVDKGGLGPCATKDCPEDAQCLNMCDRDGFTFAECVCLDTKKLKTNCKPRDKGRWTDWSDWGECSKTCGIGLYYRHRTCMHPHVEPQMEITSDNCEGIPEDVGVCEMGNCPAWKPWSEWSECTAVKSCGEGARHRNRTCEGGTPNVDELCKGEVGEAEPCFMQRCDSPIRLSGTDVFGEGRVEIYNDNDDIWGGVCGDEWDINDGKVACKQALDIDNVAEVVAGSDFGNIMFPVMLTKVGCKGNESSIQGCGHDGWRPLDQRCRAGAAGVKCVVDGIWGAWSEWTECSKSCDWGFHARYRTCDYPPPRNGGKPCEGVPQQRKKCYLKICPIDGVWMEWSSWGGCSLTCGVGYRYRNRTCDGPYYAGAPCNTDPEGEIGIAKCNTQRCPFRTCQEYRIVDGTSALSGTHLLDPDGPGDLAAYDVECDFEATPDEGVTILDHDSSDRSYVQGYEARAEYERKIHYANASLEQAIALVEASQKCEMFVKWECKSASIHEPVHTYEENHTLTLTFLTDRHAEMLDYFPGGEPGTESCACRSDGSCKNPAYWCNCDANLDDETLEDSGKVTIMEHLPLTGFYAGDTGATWEEGYHTIGALKCWGTQRALMPGQTHDMESIRPTLAPVFEG